MKLRNGFVSNSSSSSFIIAVKKDISEKKIIKSVKKMLDVFKQKTNNAIPEMFGEEEHLYIEDAPENSGYERVVKWDKIEEDITEWFGQISMGKNHNIEIGDFMVELGVAYTEESVNDLNDLNDLMAQFSIDGFNYKSDNIIIGFGDS